jgi:cobalt-zinc-cadmium efflux system membrane fusion protein
VTLAKCKDLKEQIQLMGISMDDLENGKLINTISVRSPIGGNVTHVNITKSGFVDAREVAVELVNTDHIHLELEVFEKDAMLIREGQSIHFRIPELSNRNYHGEVYLVTKAIDLEKRTVMVHGHIANEDEVNFIPGMFVEAEIEID